MSIRLPAEWELQSGIMLTWPHAGTDWRPYLADVEPVYIEIARQVGEFEPVIIACHDESVKARIMALMQQHRVSPDKLRLCVAPSNDSWARDHGPITVLDHDKPRLLDFTFNGWGNKYRADLDNRITGRMHVAGVFGDTPMQSADFVLEGGSIETDGQGTLLTTDSCLLSVQRNPGLTREEIEHRLRGYLHVERIIWFQHGQLLGDDTDGHIDTLIRFASPDTLLYVACDDPDDPNHPALALMAAELAGLKQPDGRPYRLVPLPSPLITNDGGEVLPASYANFLIINHAVLVPVYGVPPDQAALEIFKECFDDRKIIAVNCRPLIQQYGSLHCITMQFPQGVIR